MLYYPYDNFISKVISVVLNFLQEDTRPNFLFSPGAQKISGAALPSTAIFYFLARHMKPIVTCKPNLS